MWCDVIKYENKQASETAHDQNTTYFCTFVSRFVIVSRTGKYGFSSDFVVCSLVWESGNRNEVEIGRDAPEKRRRHTDLW